MKKIFICTLLIIILSGCGNNKENITNKVVTKGNIGLDKKTEEVFIGKFRTASPNALIEEKVAFDLDNDKSLDLIIAYSDPIKKTRSSFAVITKNGSNGINLSPDDKSFQFAENRPLIKTVTNPNKIIIPLYSPKKRKLINFHISLRYNKLTNLTNFTIESK